MQLCELRHLWLHMFSEVNFWNSRAENLECIYDQMKEGDVKKMAIILEQSRSAYFPAFKTMFRSVVAGESALTGSPALHAYHHEVFVSGRPE